MPPLKDKHILLVEDEFLIALTAAEMLENLGANVVGPAYKIGEALDLAASKQIDAAIVDVNIRGERSDRVIAALDKKNIPLIIASGYSEKDLQFSGSRILLKKPYTEEKLLEAVTQIL